MAVVHGAELLDIIFEGGESAKSPSDRRPHRTTCLNSGSEGRTWADSSIAVQHRLRSVDTVRRMVDAGAALAVMGNHELNAIAWHTPDSRHPGEYYLPGLRVVHACWHTLFVGWLSLRRGRWKMHGV
jgi:hypothetical protein